MTEAAILEIIKIKQLNTFWNVDTKSFVRYFFFVLMKS